MTPWGWSFTMWLLSIYKVLGNCIGNITLVCNRFYASIIAKQLGLNNYSYTDSYSKINNLPAVNSIIKIIKYLKTEFGVKDIPIKNHRLPNTYWVSKMHEKPH